MCVPVWFQFSAVLLGTMNSMLSVLLCLWIFILKSGAADSSHLGPSRNSSRVLEALSNFDLAAKQKSQCQVFFYQKRKEWYIYRECKGAGQIDSR